MSKENLNVIPNLIWNPGGEEMAGFRRMRNVKAVAVIILKEERDEDIGTFVQFA